VILLAGSCGRERRPDPRILYPSVSIASVTSPAAASGIAVAASFKDEQPCPGDLARDRLAVADGEEPVAAAVDDERGDLDLGQALAPAGFAVEPGEHHAQLERRERARMLENGHLGDHPADADPREMRGPPAERVSEGRRVGGEATQGVGGRFRPDAQR
jgi:hypothetical protein